MKDIKMNYRRNYVKKNMDKMYQGHAHDSGHKMMSTEKQLLKEYREQMKDENLRGTY